MWWCASLSWLPRLSGLKDGGQKIQNEHEIRVSTSKKGAAVRGGMARRSLFLRPGRHDDASLLRLRRGDTLRFRPSPALLGRRLFLYTNYVLDDPKDDGGDLSEFVRTQYTGLEWRPLPPEGLVDRSDNLEDDLPSGAGVLLTSVDVCADITLNRAGAYHYYFVYDTPESKLGPAGSGWFQVEPELIAGGERIPLDGIACQTVLAKCLGPLPRWEGALRVAHESGYNMVHLTPVQVLGASQSGYSISDRLKLDPRLASSDTEPATFAALDELLTRLRKEWHMLFICDVVLNHTANETPWLATQPAASYNCATCPWLRPAAVLDAALVRWSAAVARGALEPAVPRRITEEAHIQAARDNLLHHVLPDLRLHEMFCCDVPRLIAHFTTLARNKVPSVRNSKGEEARSLKLIPDPMRRRLRATVDMEVALELYNVYRGDCYEEEARVRACSDELARELERLNEAARELCAGHLRAAADNVAAGARYERLAADGPRVPDVSERRPLAPRYFTWPEDAAALAPPQLEALLGGDAAALVMAHNGWVMGADPLQDFAAQPADGRVYLRRELIAWADSVKLRFGDKPEDSPFLWAHMRDYMELTAEMFDGVRLDNCHSTPLHVAEYMLDCARNVKPNLYVLAELFTDSPAADAIFVNRLGITSLVRECLSAHDPRELGRLLHRWSGPAVGSWLPATQDEGMVGAFPHAALYDVTHDNPALLIVRSLEQAAAGAVLLAAANCAAASTRGVDELLPFNPHVVDEQRLYAVWGEREEDGVVTRDTALLTLRRVANQLHARLARDGYSEVYVDQMDDEVIAITRHNPDTRESVIVVAYTAFSSPDSSFAGRAPPPLRFEGELQEILFETSVASVASAGEAAAAAHPKYMSGRRDHRGVVARDVPLQQSGVFASMRRDAAHTELAFKQLRPGSGVALRVRPRAEAVAALHTLHRVLSAPAAEDAARLQPALADLDLPDFTVLLYRCDAEERACSGSGVYDVPGHGPLPYAGLQGALSALAGADLGHPVCANLRAGDWLLEYTWRRLQREPRLAAAARCVQEALAPVTLLPRYLVPCYAAAVLRLLHAGVARAALARMPPALRRDSFSAALALTSVQLGGRVPDAGLPPASPALAAPRSPPPSLSAGLPHFAVGYMRCWGRDTFISLRGLLLLPGRYEDARAHILGFASCLRHGLIPNLLDGGHNPRFNCRDAVWWWLQTIKYYCSEAPQGYAILSAPVSRMYPTDDAEKAPPGAVEQPLCDVMQEALQRHFQGVTFRERNAGRNLDAHMADRGFTVQVGVDPETGFPFGGNDHNCGTWMDKMGSSEAAGTRGKPATPRDGTAVELVALAYSVTSWLAAAARGGRFPHGGVARAGRAAAAWTYALWADTIRRNFERVFWIPPVPSAADARPDLVHRRAIYKDTHGATRPWADYQLRPNFVVAMAVAPDLFDPRHAWLALDNVEALLLGPLGVRTLDPADWNYRGDYDAGADSADAATAHGFNYHQGPEWVWPFGFYVCARMQFAQENGKHARTIAAGYAALAAHAEEIATSPWRGLPELTNRDGAYCAASCRSQAWSSAGVLEALAALAEARRTRPLCAE